jgi:hypothetical protein
MLSVELHGLAVKIDTIKNLHRVEQSSFYVMAGLDPAISFTMTDARVFARA